MKTIAVIGGGVSGLFAAHQLSKKHSVTLIEQSSTVGGHAYTVPVKDGNQEHFLDIAFLVFNSHAYPRFIAWMEELGVTEDFSPLEMSFGIENKNFSYSINNGIKGLNLPENILNLKFLRLLSEIKKYRRSIKTSADSGEATISEHFKRQGHSDFFIQNFIYPLAISIWSLPTQSIDSMLAQTFCQFMGHHRFLKENFSASWLTFKNSSKTYKDQVLRNKTFKVELNTPVTRVIEKNNQVQVNGVNFDACLIATQADQAAGLIENEGSTLLREFSYQKVKAFLHTDPNFMPSEKKVWSAWNILQKDNHRFITYYLNKIRPITSKRDYFLTITESFDGQNVLHETSFRHLILDHKAYKAQSKLATLNRGALAFAGSYFGKGFHEDAIVSAESAVKYLEERLA